MSPAAPQAELGKSLGFLLRSLAAHPRRSYRKYNGSSDGIRGDNVMAEALMFYMPGFSLRWLFSGTASHYQVFIVNMYMNETRE